MPLVVAGDFNCITNSLHKKCGNAFKWNPRELDLIHLKNAYGLTKLSPVNEAFTWSNNQLDGSCIWERSDYVLANPSWFNSIYNMQVYVLERIALDHSPLLLKLNVNHFQGKQIFCFEDFWIAENSYMDTISSS